MSTIQKRAKRSEVDPIGKKLDKITYLLEHVLALMLQRTDLNWSDIAKHLTVEKAKVNTMLKGTSKRNKKQ